MSISESTGRETSEPGSTRLAAREEDYRPEEPEPPPLPPDLSTSSDPQSELRLSDTTTELDWDADSPLTKSELSVLVSSSPDLLASLSTTDAKTEARKDSKPTRLDLLTTSASWSYIPDIRAKSSARPRVASAMTHLPY